jgi:hypothetical protein
MPQTLMERMCHNSIETTMTFYVGPNAKSTTEPLWAAPLRIVSQGKPPPRKMINGVALWVAD